MPDLPAIHAPGRALQFVPELLGDAGALENAQDRPEKGGGKMRWDKELKQSKAQRESGWDGIGRVQIYPKDP